MRIYKTEYIEVKVYRSVFLFLSPQVLTLKFGNCNKASCYDLTSLLWNSEKSSDCTHSSKNTWEKQSVPSRIPFITFYKQRKGYFASF